MSLNNIQLPDFLIEEWYSDNLINSSPVPPAPRPAPGLPPSAAPTPPPFSAPPPPSSSAPSPPAPSAPSALKYLGNNHRHITILVHAPGSPFLPDNQLTFLTKILEACRLTLADVAIVNNAAAETTMAVPITIADIRRQLAPKTILLFGPEPSALRLPINFPPFKPLDYDGCTYLSAPGLDHLVTNTEESKLLKSKLWVCLQTIFDV
jgi:hypothetical protein